MRIARLRACALGLALLSTTIPSAWASGETISLTLGGGSTFRLERPFERVLIDHPQVVDVHEQTDRLVFLEALSLGTANIVFLDARSVAIANIKVVVSGARA